VLRTEWDCSRNTYVPQTTIAKWIDLLFSFFNNPKKHKVGLNRFHTLKNYIFHCCKLESVNPKIRFDGVSKRLTFV